MKNKKGFTLIELLVVISLMLSILGIAIVSFINISNKKKEESWEKVKEQSELAAEEYFQTYKYYLENLGSNNAYARVSIGKLVEEDFLNKATNPITGKSVNECDYVEVTIGTSGSGYLYKYHENNDGASCNVSSYVIVSEVGAPEISVDITKGTKKNNDYYVTDVDVTATLKTAGNGAIKDLKYCTSTSKCDIDKDLALKSGKENSYTITNYSLKNSNDGIDGSKVTTYFVATNTSNKTVIGSVTYKKDTKDPTCDYNNGSTTWIKGTRTIKQYCLDETSGCTKNPFSKKFENTTKTSSITITDNAGNSSSCAVNVYVDNTKPTCGNNNGSTTWTNQDRTITQECSDSDSGCSSVVKKYNSTTKTSTITISDNVGNSNVCNVNVYVDKDKPKFTVGLYKVNSASGTSTATSYSNNTWYNKYVYTKLSVTEKTLSDIKSITYTTTGATKNEENKAGSSRNINEEGTSKITYKVCNNAGSCATGSTYTIKLDHTPPVIKYLDGPKKQECGGASGVYIKYQVYDGLSGVMEAYHYYGSDTGKKDYDTISGYDMKVISFTSSGNNGPYIIERNWAVGNPSGCASENKNGPNTSWCYYNNTAVKDYAGNTSTGISSSCSKVGK